MVGKAKLPPYLDAEWTLSQFSNRRERARILYEEFVDAGRRLPYPPKPP
jgi:hypothetical protein